VAKWSELSPDALITLHRIFVRGATTDEERLARHERAISFDWLAGNRDRAVAAANTLAQGSPAFKQRWEKISSGLPQ
jgi:cobalamin biosynthesis protein CbiG